jgi:hypothetical protein
MGDRIIIYRENMDGEKNLLFHVLKGKRTKNSCRHLGNAAEGKRDRS